MEISENAAYSPVILRSELSNVNSTAAFPTGFLPVDPLKMTSDIDCPRNCLADISPVTQRTASTMLDLPQPLGPTMAFMLLEIGMLVASTNDLKPTNWMRLSCIE